MKNLNLIFDLLLLPFRFVFRLRGYCVYTPKGYLPQSRDAFPSGILGTKTRPFSRLLTVFGILMIFSVSGWSACGTTVDTWDTTSISIYNHSDSVRRTADSYTIQVASPGSLDLNVTNTYSGDKSLNAKLYSTSDCSGTPLWDVDLTTSGSLAEESFTVTNGNYYLEIIANDNFTIPYDIDGTFKPAEVEGTLVITKTDSVDPVDRNGTFLYYIDVTNNTETTVTNLHLTDTIEDDVTLHSVTNSSFNTDANWTCTTVLKEIDCTLLSLDVNDTLRLELNVTAPAFETTLLNIAYITADNNISENATANTTVTDENVSGGVDVSLYRIDTVDEYTFTNYTTEGPILKTKIAAKNDYPFDLVHLDPSTFAPTTYRGAQTGTVAPLIVLLYLADDDCNQLENIYLTGDDDLLARVVLQQGDISASVVSPVVMPSLAMKKARILAKFDDLNDNNLTASELRCVLRSSTSGNLGDLPQCFNSERRLVEVFGARGTYCLDLFNGNGPCKSNYGNPSAPYTAPYGIEPACYSCLIGGSIGECSRDNFAIRPERFDVNITTSTPLEMFIAGKDTNLVFQALDAATTPIATVDYNETQDTSFYVDLNVSNNSGCQIKNLTITPNVSFSNGIHQDDFRFSDIGDINMSIHETNGTEFAIVDFGDTPLDDRLIQEYNASFTVIPDHFNIDANLTDHNTDNNFTYLHDINRYDAVDNYEMGALLSIDVEAVGADDNITRNYMETCYAKDTNVTLGLSGTNITYPGSTQPLDLFVYYNPVEDDGSLNAGEGNTSLPAAVSNTISLSSLNIENIESTFPPDAPDGNGTTHIEYKLNFDRKQHLAVNPFQISVTDANITDTDGVQGSQTGITDQNATMYYARSRSSLYFYEDVTTSSILTPIIIDVYCDLGTTCLDDYNVEIYSGFSGGTDNENWFISMDHTNNDGNVTVMVDTPLIEGSGSPTVNAVANPTPTNITTWTNGIDGTVTVATGANPTLPMTVPIKLVRESDSPTPASFTHEWLIYNPDSAFTAPYPFYKVRFIGNSAWTGTGNTGDVVNIDASRKKSKRMDW